MKIKSVTKALASAEKVLEDTTTANVGGFEVPFPPLVRAIPAIGAPRRKKNKKRM